MTDVPVPGDYDGDGMLDTAFWRPSEGNWYVQPGSGGQQRVVQFGQDGDIPVPSDFDRDGKLDFAVWRPSDRMLRVRPSSGLPDWALLPPQDGEVPRPADYDALILFAYALFAVTLRLEAAGRPDGALPAARESIRVFLRLAASPGDLPRASFLARVVELAGLLPASEAVAPTQDAVTIQRRLVDADPANLDHQIDLAYALFAVTLRLEAAGRPDGALPAARESIRVFLRLAASPGDLPRASFLARVVELAGLLPASEAVAPTQDAVTIQRRLVDADPANLDHQIDLAYALFAVTLRLEAAGRPDGALPAARESIRVFLRLAASPGDLPRASFLARVVELTGLLPASEAVAPTQDAVTIQRRLVDADPANLDHQIDLAASLHSLTLRLEAAGRPDEALTAASEAEAADRRVYELQSVESLCTGADTPATQLSQADAEEATLCLVNGLRTALGFPALTRNMRLKAAAQWHAQEAARIRWWTPGGGPEVHRNPETLSMPADRIRAIGYCPGQVDPPTNENCYDHFVFGSNPPDLSGLTPKAAFGFWRRSALHNATMLNPAYRETGIAVILGVAEKGGDADRADARGPIIVQTFGACDRPEAADAGLGWAWGDNAFGQVGDGTENIRLAPVRPQGLGGVIGIAGGGWHSLALKYDGSVWAWGRNNAGQLGDGTPYYSDTRVLVDGASGVMGISAGLEHSLALKRDGSVWAWGENRDGQLGDGTRTARNAPVIAQDVGGVIGIAAGAGHSLALKRDGSVWAWGDNWAGQLGDGTTTRRLTRVMVGGVADVIGIAAGVYYSLALKRDGTVWAWGINHYGELGIGSTDPLPSHFQPVPVAIEGAVAAIAAGMNHSLALMRDGTVWAWGLNSAGQLGDGTTTERHVPVKVQGVTGVVAIAAAGTGHSLALKRDGTVWAWGSNNWGQLGDGTQTDRHIPGKVQGVNNIMTIAAGFEHNLAL
ncbi:CAP domain-containing protein [Streptomyces sp. NBC_01210]|uniref:RCC1 domain-containing protein n=1 Tax=Streptomyces sp. NBC_01210 TaxID=2903774 RepID=UPI002E105849|nr:CAP domain-containing protein [Streptomyces sp. NBC_01210]